MTFDLDEHFTCKRACSKFIQDSFNSEEEEQLFREFIEGSSWRAATTYEKTAPHQYCVKEDMNEEDKLRFEEVVRLIRQKGYDAPFFHTSFRYFYYQGYSYFTCEGRVKEQGVINRARGKCEGRVS